MANDSTELTFVRCPSCRSLVPAISTKCRMCGAALEATSSSDSADEGKRNGSRVRQRTSSEPKSDLSNAVKALREEHTSSSATTSTPPSAPPPVAVKASANTDKEDDPLADYIEELEDSSESVESKDPFSPVLESKESNEDSELGDLDELDDVDQILEPKGEKEPVVAAPVESDPFEQPSDDSDDFYNPFVKKVKVEEEHKAVPAAEKVVAPIEEKKEKVMDPFTQIVDPKVTRESAKQKSEREVVSKEEQPKKQKVEAPKKEIVARKSAEVSKSSPSKLVGWLVSFVDPKGSAIELREGKIFVTANQLKGESLILEEETISTPHALLQVSVSNGLVVQDLMSEHGVYIKRRGSSEFVREEDVATLENGDSLRFGEVEFLLTLIPYGDNE